MQQLPRTGTLHIQLCMTGSDVGDDCVLIAEVTAHPRLDVSMGGIGGHDPESIVVEFRHREIGLDHAGIVQPLRVGDHARIAIDVVR